MRCRVCGEQPGEAAGNRERKEYNQQDGHEGFVPSWPRHLDLSTESGDGDGEVARVVSVMIVVDPELQAAVRRHRNRGRVAGHQERCAVANAERSTRRHRPWGPEGATCLDWRAADTGTRLFGHHDVARCVELDAFTALNRDPGVGPRLVGLDGDGLGTGRNLRSLARRSHRLSAGRWGEKDLRYIARRKVALTTRGVDRQPQRTSSTNVGEPTFEYLATPQHDHLLASVDTILSIGRAAPPTNSMDATSPVPMVRSCPFTRMAKPEAFMSTRSALIRSPLLSTRVEGSCASNAAPPAHPDRTIPLITTSFFNIRSPLCHS